MRFGVRIGRDFQRVTQRLRRDRNIEHQRYPVKRRAVRPGNHNAGRTVAAAAHADQARRCEGARSEEHTSELQSLMRISYAVFCLKKKKKTKNTTTRSKPTTTDN